MIKYRPLRGASARVNISAMIKQATDDVVVALLDGEMVIVRPGQTDACAIESEWRRAKDTREGWYVQIAKAQTTLAAQMTALLDLDFTDLGAIIDWFEVTVAIDRRFALVSHDDIAQIFALYSFFGDVPPGRDETDREAAARYIIGQALSSNVRAVDRYTFSRMAHGWRERFEPVSSH